NSHAMTATRRPRSSASPVTTDSSVPDRSAAAVSSARYAADTGTGTTGLSQDTKDPGSTNSPSRSAAERLTSPTYPPRDVTCGPRGDPPTPAPPPAARPGTAATTDRALHPTLPPPKGSCGEPNSPTAARAVRGGRSRP